MSDPRDEFGWGEELQRDPDPPPRRNLLLPVLIVLAVVAVAIAWLP